MKLPYTPAILRFPRRYPLSFLVLLIPLALLLYANFGQINAWAANKIVPLDPGIRPSTPTTVSPDSNATQVNDILLVSAFFPLSKSKHSMRQYSNWLSHFLGAVTTDIYFYTTPDLEPTIREIRGLLPITIDTSFESVFDVEPLKGREEDYKKMHEWDREKDHHSHELYAIWNSKPYLLAEAVRTQNKVEKVYKYAFWSDAGSFREKHAYSNWPGYERVEELWEEGRRESGMKADELIFFPIQHLPEVSMLLWKENLGPIDNDFSEGSFFGGQQKAVLWYEKYFYAYHDYYLKQKIFVGKDQTLINSLFLLHPERFLTVWHGDPEAPVALFKPETTSSDDSVRILGDCGDQWYYYQFFLASEHEQASMRKIWDSTWEWDVWHSDWWTRRRESCRVSRLLAMEWLLKRPFGEMWFPPPASVPF